MKWTYWLLIMIGLGVFPLASVAQQTINGTITHDGMQRSYILYLPKSYAGNVPFPLVFNFHGYTSNAQAQMNYGDFRPVADTGNFLVVHPQGTLFNGNTHWNVGGWTLGSQTDDVDFTRVLIDSLSANYNIDMDRVYATGMSNGGFLSYLLGCQLSSKIAAVASVTGSMTPQTFSPCNPGHPMPSLQIHGTIDDVIPYGGNSFSRSIEDVIEYWANVNNCDPTPIKTLMPEVNTVDFSRVERYVYANGDRGATSEHFKVIGGAHTWPGTAFPSMGTNYDINASVEIWKFFSRYDLQGLRNTVSNDPQVDQMSYSIAPNPVLGELYISGPGEIQEMVYIYDIFGRMVIQENMWSQKQQVNVASLPSGTYYLKIAGQTLPFIK
ncbi:MAG: T9SS type A sorting domain-containing protein [Bacteroidota bacterium]